MHTLILTQQNKAHTHTDSMLLKGSPCSHWIRLSIIEPETEYETECVFPLLDVSLKHISLQYLSHPSLISFSCSLPASSFFFSSLQPPSNLPKYHNAFSFLFCFTCCVIDQCSPNARTPSQLQCVIVWLGCSPVEPICSISVSRVKCRSGRASGAKPTYVSRPVIPRWAAHRGVRVYGGTSWGVIWKAMQSRLSALRGRSRGAKGCEGGVCICLCGTCREKVKQCWWRVMMCGVPFWQ